MRQAQNKASIDALNGVKNKFLFMDYEEKINKQIDRGGDEFAVIVKGRDYKQIDQLVDKMAEHNSKALEEGGIVIACGMAKLEDDNSFNRVFERADQRMYEDKKRLKEK